MTRALLTDSERRALRGDHERDRAEYEAASRVRRRVRDDLADDLQLLADHRPDLFRDVVAAVDAARADRPDAPDAVAGAVEHVPRDVGRGRAPTPAPSERVASAESAPATERPAWRDLDLAGSGRVLEARRRAVRACYELVRREGRAEPKDFRERVLAGAGLDSKPRTEWRRVRAGLQQVAEHVDAFDAPGEGGSVYRWTPDE